jgi:uncharacterized protein (TIGR02270 family)
MVALSILNRLNVQKSYHPTYGQYAGDAAFLWILRSIAINQPHYNANDLFELEQRIEALLGGLMSSIDMGWQACDDALQFQEPGELFTAMVIAMRSHESHKIQRAVEVGLEHDLATPGLISAMGWLPAEIANSWTERFLKGKEMSHKYLGLAVCSVRRHDPGEILSNILQRDDCQQNEKLYARALRLVGELRRQDCMPAINAAMSVESSEIKFWANWSAVLLGHRASVLNLQSSVFNAGPQQPRAIQMAFRALPIETAREWISKLSEDESQVRIVIKAAGALGDPHAINWLIEKMKNPALARLAGEAFASITGVDLKQNQLLIDPADHPPSTPDDTLDIAVDEDEHLPYPDAEKVMALWRNYGKSFSIGHRYFMGQLITAATLKEALAKGNQRQRHAAAMELALNEQGVPLLNTSARVLL